MGLNNIHWVLSREANKSLRVYGGKSWMEATVDSECRVVIARVSVGQNNEAELALCLATLVQAGVINIEKLRAALVIAEPVAVEIVATEKKEREP